MIFVVVLVLSFLVSVFVVISRGLVGFGYSYLGISWYKVNIIDINGNIVVIRYLVKLGNFR